MNDCIFCKIIAKEISSQFIEETDDLIVIKDIAPKAPVHYLIIPKKHIKDIQSMDAVDTALAGKMVAMAKRLSEKYLNGGAFRLAVNSGYDVGQRVFHLHFHVLGGKKMQDL